MKVRRWIGSAVVIGLVLPISSLGGANGTDWRVSPRKAKTANPIPADDESLTIGLELYQAECESCHGTGGAGDGPEADELEKPVPDVTQAEIVAQSDGALFWKITQGRKPMPSYRKLFDTDERWHVVNFLRTLAPASEVSASKNPFETPGKGGG